MIIRQVSLKALMLSLKYLIKVIIKVINYDL